MDENGKQTPDEELKSLVGQSVTIIMRHAWVIGELLLLDVVAGTTRYHTMYRRPEPDIGFQVVIHPQEVQHVDAGGRKIWLS